MRKTEPRAGAHGAGVASRTRSAADHLERRSDPAGGCSCWIGFRPPGPTEEPLGIAILVNGYWKKDKPPVLANNHGPAMLKQVAAAI
ncbi:hypothetical protein AWC15_17035 [Mycobacterium lacus]|nr:hypothetical protein AWC15_17035 [Mycobacterium lacus]